MGLLLSSAHLMDNRSLLDAGKHPQQGREELKFPLGREGEVLQCCGGACAPSQENRHKWGSQGCAEQFSQLLQLSCKQKSEGGGFLRCVPARLTSSVLAVAFA